MKRSLLLGARAHTHKSSDGARAEGLAWSSPASGGPAPGPGAETSGRDRFTPFDWLFAAAVVQTILYNPNMGGEANLNFYLSGITWPVVGIAAVLRWITQKDRWFLQAVNALCAAVLGLFALILAQLWAGGMQGAALASLLRLAYVPVTTLAALAAYRSIQRHVDIAVLALAAKDIGLILQLVQGPIDLARRLDPLGLGGFNVFAAFSAFLVVLRVSMWLLGNRRPSPVVGGALLISAVTILPTFSRSGFLALMAGICMAGTLKAQDRRRNWLTVGLLLMIASALPFVAGEAITKRITQLSITASSGRLEIWRIAWQGFWQSPVFGKGFGSFLAYSRYVFMDGRNYTSSAHNLVLQILYEGGVVGLAAVAGGVWLVLRRCWNPVILPAMVAILIDSIFSTFPMVIQVSWILGVILSAGLHARADQGCREGSGWEAWRAGRALGEARVLGDQLRAAPPPP